MHKGIRGFIASLYTRILFYDSNIDEKRKYRLRRRTLDLDQIQEMIAKKQEQPAGIDAEDFEEQSRLAFYCVECS